MKNKVKTKKFAEGGKTEPDADTAFVEDNNAPVAPEKKGNESESPVDEAKDKLESLENKVDNEIKPAEEDVEDELEELEDETDDLDGEKEDKDKGLVYFLVGGLIAAVFGIKWSK